MGRKSDARLRLMDAGHELIWSQSYGAVTVDRICEHARVKKGSFYHFFDSKSDLAASATRAWWDEFQVEVQKLFRPEIPPLERIRQYFERVTHHQIESYEKNGQILGCPLFCLGSEICTQDERLRVLIQEILDCLTGHFEEAIRQAQLSGEVEGNDAARKARLLWAVYEGTLTRARIENNPERVRTLSSDARALLMRPLVALRSAPGAPAERETFAELIFRWKHADEMVVLTDPAGLIEWVNEPFVRTCGYSLQELRGKKPGTLLQGPKSDRLAVEILRDAVRSRQACECRIINYKKDGSPYPVHIALGPVFTEKRLDGFIAIEKALSEEEHLATASGMS